MKYGEGGIQLVNAAAGWQTIQKEERSVQTS
jgi:hypothetical protein